MARLIILSAALFAACSEEADGPSVGPLEIGVRVPPCNAWGEACAGAFQPLSDGDAATVLLDPHGSLDMLLLSLRARDLDPDAPRPAVSVTVAGAIVAANAPGDRADMLDDGTGFVLWDLRVPFQQNYCCYACRDGRVTARIEDAVGRVFEGQVTALLRRGDACPDPEACCASAEACPDPAMTHVCEDAG